MNEHLDLPSDTNAPRARAPQGRWALIGAGVLSVVGAIVYFTRGHAAHQADPASARDVPRLENGVIRFSPTFAKRAGITVTPCASGSLSPLVSVTGTVAFDPRLVAAVGSPIEGRLRRILKFPGDHVAAGEVVAEVESAALGQAQAGLTASRAHAEAASANEKRENDLANAHVSSQREAEIAKATAAAARAEVLAAEQKIKAFGGGSYEIGVLPLRSPIAGKVVELKMSRGQSIDANSMVLRVADLSRVWIDLAVFERELGQIHRDDPVEITLQSDASVVLPGKVAHVGDVIDLGTRSAPVRIEVDNSKERLRAGQSVVATIHTAAGLTEGLRVPLDAVTSVDGKSIVFVSQGENAVEPRTVVLGAKDATHALVASGLKLGEPIVSGGAFALKAEIFR
jgi:membrane fusion protein, heavy metal efflux system